MKQGAGTLLIAALLAALLAVLLSGPLSAQVAGAESLRAQRRECARGLAALVEQHRRAARMPWLAIATVDVDAARGCEWQWSTGCGDWQSDGAGRQGPSAVVRAGSLSKVVTATAVMALVEQGRLELDAPVQRWLPWFRPRHAGDGAITLRLLLAHRSGLPRQSPVGHWYDDSDPGLEATVRSLADVELRSEPGREYCYSNAGYAVAGRIVEAVCGQPFAAAAAALVLEPLGMRESSFARRPDLLARAATGRIETIDGRAVVPATFALGCAPAAELRTTVGDLALLLRSWLPDAPAGVLSPPGQRALWQPPGGADGPALGCFVDRSLGTLRVRHGGTVYGFTSELQALPDEGLAVALAGTGEFANAQLEALAADALQALRACRRGDAVAVPPPAPTPVGAAAARALAGRYRRGDEWFDLAARGEDLWFDPCVGVATVQRRLGDRLVSDDPMSAGDRVLTVLASGAVHDGVAEFARAPDRAPLPAPPALVPLLGEYGWDRAVLIVYEDEQRLGLLLDGRVRELPERPARPERAGDAEWLLPEGAYGGERLRFERGADGAVAAAWLGAVRWPRRLPLAGVLQGERPFRITPRRPLAELRRELAAAPARPPAGGTRAADLVDLRGLDARLRFDIKYASSDNFLGTEVYERAAPMLQRPAAAGLCRALGQLAAQGFGLCVFDGYRPWSVTRLFWEATPEAMRQFVADPARGSRHNRGCAVDLTLCDLRTGAPVEMPSGYDEFTPRAYPDWPGGTALQRWHRRVLRAAMEDAGFTVYEFEWWHFDWRGWQEYPVLDQPLR